MRKRINYSELRKQAIRDIIGNTPVPPELIVPIDVPDGVSHQWAIETYTVDEKQSSFDKLRALVNAHNEDGYEREVRYVDAGTYKKLVQNGAIIMSNTPNEIADHMPLIDQVMSNPSSEQEILINGLGLGVVIEMLRRTNKVKHVTVNELQQDVIILSGQYYQNKYGSWITINHTDAFKFKPEKGFKYDAIWHDIWPDIASDNILDMNKLHHKYGSFALWQSSWCRDVCLFIREQRKRRSKRLPSTL